MSRGSDGSALEGSAVTPGGQGHFEGFDVLRNVGHWDPVTARVVLARMKPALEARFFTPGEQATAGALFDQLVAQHDEPKVPVLMMVDRRLSAGETDGWRYADMAEDGEAWRITLAALDEEAEEAHGQPFHRLASEHQEKLVQAVQDAKVWHQLPAPRVWSLWTRYACTAFYSHPWAWNEIGFGGPAYPRGYKAIGINKREGWEVADRADTDPVPLAEQVAAARRAAWATSETPRKPD
jgi:hypothetical protein